MVQFTTINVETGDYVKYNYKTGEEQVINKSDKILCYGGKSHKGIQVVLRNEIPNSDSIAEPTLLYRDSSMIVINPKTGPSVVSCKGTILDIQHRVICVVRDGRRCLCITNTHAIFIYKRKILAWWEHRIPDLDGAITKPGCTSKLCMYVYRENTEETYWFLRRSLWTRIESGPVYYADENDGACEAWMAYCEYATIPMQPIIDSDKFRIVSCMGLIRLIDMKTGGMCWCPNYFGLVELLQKTIDVAVIAGVAKIYQNDGTMFILTGGDRPYQCKDSPHLPKLKSTNTKSARSS